MVTKRVVARMSFVPLLLLAAGCATGTDINPFLTLSEDLGFTASQSTSDNQSSSSGNQLTSVFRQDMTVTFRNNNTDADLETTFVAWVKASSIRSAEQQDQLIADGYVQISKQIELGSAYTLPVGTFIYGGPGTAGATAIRLLAAGDEASTESITLLTPDVVLVFSQPPVSCESVAFTFTREGDPTTSVPLVGASGPFGGSNTTGGFKTLAQVDAYQCSPLQPGLFIRLSGGISSSNEYFDGSNVTFDFNATPDADGNFCIVTIES